MQHVLSCRYSGCKSSLIPGKSICTNCFSKLFSDDKGNADMNSEYVPPEDNIQQVDAVCSILGLSSASKRRKLRNEKRAVALQSKVERVTHVILKSLVIGYDKYIPDVNKTLTNNEPLHDEYARLINELKEKRTIANKEEKVRVLCVTSGRGGK